MYQIRIPDTISKDIYVIGKSIVIHRQDKLLSKVIKPIGTSNREESVYGESVRLIGSSDLIETCVVLRDTVTNFAVVVSFNAFCYADDLMLASLTFSGLQHISDVANKYITEQCKT